jgi:1,4-dihydroxy-2-naphthoyl-CoA hydrolase
MEAMASGEQPEVGPVGALFDKLGGEFIEVTAERAVARIPVEGNTQPLGYLHGGATAALAETVASVGAWMASEGQPTFGLEIKVNHLRSVRSGWITAIALPLHVGRTTQVWEIRVHDDDDRLVAFSTCTLSTRAQRPER